MKASSGLQADDLFYAPGLKVRHRKSGEDVRFWYAPRIAVAAGFEPKMVKFDPDLPEYEVAEACRGLLQSLTTFKNNGGGGAGENQLTWRYGRIPHLPKFSNFKGQGGVYFLQCLGGDNYIKIGYTTRSPALRKKGIMTGCPYPLRLLAFEPGPPVLERHVHYRLRFHRVNGEWFEANSAVLRFIKTFAAEVARMKEREQEQTFPGCSGNDRGTVAA